MSEFFRTHMGMQFFQGTLPRLVALANRWIDAAQERRIASLRKRGRI